MSMKTYGKDSMWPFSEGSGSTLLIVTLGEITAVSLFLLWPNLGTGILLFLVTCIWLLILYFFRDPNRNPINEPGLVIGPGDGEVVEIKTEV